MSPLPAMNLAMHWSAFNPHAQFALAAGLIGGALFVSLRPLWQGKIATEGRHDWGWAIFIFLILAAGRWPSILYPLEINADENQLFGGAHSTWLDPVFWRSVDGQTSGPLNFFALWPAGLLCGWDTYVAPRLTALVLLAATLLLVHQGLSLLTGRTVARLAGLSVLTMEALTHLFELLHYSSELVSIALIAAATYLGIRRWKLGEANRWNFLGGLLLGAVPLAKLQAAPLALIMGLAWVGAEIHTLRGKSLRSLLHLALGALLPLFLFAFQAALAGVWARFVISYLELNLNYTGDKAELPASLWSMLLHVSLSNSGLYHLWLGASVPALALLLGRWPARPRSLRMLTLLSLVATAGALLCILAPWRPTWHYWQLLIGPAIYLQGALLANLLTPASPSVPSGPRWRTILAVLLPMTVMLLNRAGSTNPLLQPDLSWADGRPTILSQRIIPYIRPGDTIAIWGWSNYVNVETGLPLVMRDGNLYPLLVRSPYVEYFRNTYLQDFIERHPVFFLDSIGPCSTIFQDPRWRHEQVSRPLAAVVQTNYVLLFEVDGARFYQRKDLVGR